MNIEVLKTYKIVAERGSLTAASRELGVSQPAVSMQIASLEEYFGARLLNRTARGVDLTIAGQHVLDLANKFENSVLKARNYVADVTAEIEGELRISASNIPGMYILPKLANDFRSKNPKVRVRLEIENSRKAIDKLLSGEVHIAAIGDKITNERVDISPITNDKIILIAPADFDSREITNFKNLFTEQVPLLRRSEGSSTSEIINEFFKYTNIDVKKLNTVGLYSSVIPQINSVIAGSGLAFVSELAAESALKLKQVVKVDIMGLPIERQLYLVIKKTGERNRVENAFWKMIMNEVI